MLPIAGLLWGPNVSASRSIYPGPECLVGEASVDRDTEHTLQEHRGDIVFDGRVLLLVEPSPLVGVALAHVRARARMERFVAWLRKQGAGYDGEGYRCLLWATHKPSPEFAMMGMVDSGNVNAGAWLAVRVCPLWGARMERARLGTISESWRVMRRLLASPEWASLPWQQETGGASTGSRPARTGLPSTAMGRTTRSSGLLSASQRCAHQQSSSRLERP